MEVKIKPIETNIFQNTKELEATPNTNLIVLKNPKRYS